MRKKLFMFVLSLLPCAPLFSVPFEVGEEMHFEIQALNIKAASQKVIVEAMTNIHGRDAYKIHSWIRTTPFGDTFYKMRDETVTYIDKENFNVLKMIDRKLEGDWKNDTFLTNDLENQLFYLRDRHGQKTMGYEPPLLDLVAMLFYGRTLDLTPGRKYSFIMLDNGKLRRIDTVISQPFDRKESVLGKEKIRMVKIKELKTDEKSKDVSITLTHDERKIPVRIVSMKIKLLGLDIGNIESELTKYKAK
jgi:hypothetical protein